MIKKLSIQIPAVDETMSNLTSASGEASFSSTNRNDNGGLMYPPQYNLTPFNNQATKKKRNQPGHPDPESEVIALSPRTLLATNRFVCEICKKGFQRDQNLQLHKRGHNLPWKLKQRSTTEIVRKKVYVCPEINCVHNDPSRALGDLTGIKKHFCRKHGEKKWKCEKCSKKYAVQSDWKAHSKTCGTREYRCECGTLFSRRDSFITHRAFCDALAEESVRSITGNSNIINNNNPIIHTSLQNTLSNSTNSHHINLQQIQSQFNNNHNNLSFPVKKEQQQFTLIRPEIPPWLPIDLTHPSSSSSSSTFFQDFQDYFSENPNPNFTPVGPTTYQLPPSPHFSATALLQKASQMGSKVSTINQLSPHVSVDVDHHQISTTGFGLNLSSRDGFFNGLTSYGNKLAEDSAAAADNAVIGGSTSVSAEGPTTLLHEMMMMNSHNHISSSSNGFDTFQDVTLDGILNKKDEAFSVNPDEQQFMSRRRIEGVVGASANDNMTRDFLGLRPLYDQGEILSIGDLARQMQEK